MKSNVSTYTTLLFCFAHASLMAQTETISLSNTVGEVAYESKDHRSNVYEVVSDRKTISNNQFQGIIIAATDYYPYGSEIPTRSLSEAEAYKYGFQGQEKDEEVKGNGNSFNYKYRMHDARVGRFFTVDPLATKYPHYSSYQFSGNKTTAYVELEGLEEEKINENSSTVVYDYTNTIEKNKESPNEIYGRRLNARAHTSGDNNVFITKIETDADGNKTESSFTIDFWGSNEDNKVNSGVMIIEVNLKENTYKETVLFLDNLPTVTEKKYIATPKIYPKRHWLAKWEEEVFEPAAFNWITQDMPVIRDVYSIIEGIEGKQKNVHGITQKELSNAESWYKIGTGTIGLISGFKKAGAKDALEDFIIDEVKHYYEPDVLQQLIENESIKKE